MMLVGDLPVAIPLDQPYSQSEIERTGCRAIAMHFAHHETYAVACADLQTAWRECDRTTPACEEEVPSFVVLGYAANGVWKIVHQHILCMVRSDALPVFPADGIQEPFDNACHFRLGIGHRDSC